MSLDQLRSCPCCEHGGIKNIVELLADNGIALEVRQQGLILAVNLPSTKPSRGEYSTAEKLLPPKALGLVIAEPDFHWSKFVDKGIGYMFASLLSLISSLMLCGGSILLGIGWFTEWEWYDDPTIILMLIAVLLVLGFPLAYYSRKRFKQIQRDNKKEIEAGQKREEEKYYYQLTRRQEQITRYLRLVYCYTCQKFFDPVVIKGQKRSWKAREMAKFLAG